MPPEGELAAQAGNTSSDFVRKLYKMLEDPAYHSVVRWGNEGDSFVVLENEKFTKTILPKHFKHSNFASFVRQLNKYDFHKVRQNDDSGQSPYGPDAWEFKHPEFHQNNKDNLDNIRRKAPAPRKAPVADDSFMATQQANLLNETVSATQHQVQALQNQYDRLLQANKALFDEVVNLHKMMKAQSQVHHELLSHLSSIDERRRNSRHSAHSSHSSHSGQFHHAPLGMLPDSADEPAAELRRAREILNAIPPEPVLDRELERLNAMFQAGSPPDSATSSVMYTSSSAPLGLSQDPLGPDMQHLVYPVGQTAGIDPFHADHINNIPYTRPLSNPNHMAEAPAQITPPPSKEAGGSLWGSTKPRILLVEDDRVCMRIGSKFLTQVDCKVDTAKDGSEAVAKVNEDAEQYDLIFMDIIMPVFDGVSATACIRLVAPRVPIVAMTSNIRGEDIATYFHWGMNDVLAKPFTKDGMVRILRKHLPHLLKNPPPTGSSGDDLMMSAGPGAHAVSAYSNAAGMTLSPLSAGPPNLPPSCGPMKYETTPIQSPATTTSWHSPGTITNASPHMDGGAFMGNATNGGQQMVLASGGTQRPPGYHGGPPPPPMRGRADGLQGDDRPEKRQRVYGPGQAQYSH